jgi:hypothetical protein
MGKKIRFNNVVDGIAGSGKWASKGLSLVWGRVSGVHRLSVRKIEDFSLFTYGIVSAGIGLPPGVILAAMYAGPSQFPHPGWAILIAMGTMGITALTGTQARSLYLAAQHDEKMEALEGPKKLKALPGPEGPKLS